MKIHEYQAKEIFKKFGVAVPKGDVAFTVEDAEKIAADLGGKVVVKAQIHAGGRGKGGGVKLANSTEEATQIARNMLGMKLITPQTGPQGKEVTRILVAEQIDIQKELYAGIVLDRIRSQNVFMVSTEGGVEIEKVAAETPEKIIKEYIDPAVGFQPFQARKLAYSLNLEGEQVKACTKFLMALYRAYEQSDASLAEINPLVVTVDGQVLALDAKMNFDDNALYRHPEAKEMRDLSEEDPSEVEASKYNLNYIRLDGEVGCVVNGAGLAMATMDIIKLAGGEPANFLDVGGVASSETVENGFKILLDHPKLKSILINIFGGIVRCDRVAQGVVDALSKVQVDVPIVVRLEGTNAGEARRILDESPLHFIVADHFQDAAEKAVAAAQAA
jgi:succinyl-CoA synthetase beta subunit